jgi:hypothetical protein
MGPENKSRLLHKFFAAIESTVCVGNWADENVVRITTLKLTDAAGLFLRHTQRTVPERKMGHIQNRFQKTVQRRKDGPIPHLSTPVGQAKKDESPQYFADRGTSFARKTTSRVAGTATQWLCNEQVDRMLLANYIGQTGTLAKSWDTHFPAT